MSNPDTVRGWQSVIDGVDYIDNFFDADWLLGFYNKIKDEKFEFRGVSSEPDGTGLNQFWFLDLLEGDTYKKDVKYIDSHFQTMDMTSVVCYPVFNRVVKFNAKFNHRALPNIRTNAFRYTVAFKTEEAMGE